MTMSGETMNTETMNTETMNLNTDVTTLYINTILCIIGCVLGIVRLSLGLLSSSFIIIGYGLSLCSVCVEKSMIYVSEDIAILYVNKNIQNITKVVNLMLSKNVYDNHLLNSLLHNQTLSEMNEEYDGDDEYDNSPGHIRDDDSDDESDDEDEDEYEDEEVTKINNIFESLETTDDLQTNDDDDYADLPDLIPFDYNENDDYTEIPNLNLISRNYVDDDIMDVTEQHLIERDANKVVVDLTFDTNETN